MNSRLLLEFFDARSQQDRCLVLATVVQTTGSTYSKAGDYMLLDDGGAFCGMLSGGCLESDLQERAATVLADNQAQTAVYNLSPDDELWGLGVGCEGTMEIYLQPLTADDDYLPFTAIVSALDGREPKSVSISPTHDIVVMPSPTLLILGAGPDSEPLINIAAELGWKCTIVDHRPAYLADRKFPAAVNVRCIEADRLSSDLDLSVFDMALVMSHHLVSDRFYLLQLAATDIGYVGLLGPPNRRDRLLKDLGRAAKQLADRLSAPAGIRFGGRGPAAIAVEIIAEMQQFLELRKSQERSAGRQIE